MKWNGDVKTGHSRMSVVFVLMAVVVVVVVFVFRQQIVKPPVIGGVEQVYEQKKPLVDPPSTEPPVIGGVEQADEQEKSPVDPPSTEPPIIGGVEQAESVIILDSPPIFLVDQKYYATAELMTVERDGHKFWVVTLEVPKGTKIRSLYSGELYYGWKYIMGQKMQGITIEYPSIENFQRGQSVSATDLVFIKQNRMVREGEVVAEAGKTGKIFFYFGPKSDKETLRLHFPQLFNGVK
ncbi:MAG: hypothetical protein DDT41_01475 [candidate division WS2 bacterium]|nr:hypothetical protein [Candidatus Psychracetigena formicireducens]